MKKILDYLQQLGLSKIEAMLYWGLLETGPTTIKQLAHHTRIKRITAHFNIENLIEKGLVVETALGGRRQIVAESPEKLSYLIELKEKEINQLKNDFSGFLKTVHANLIQSKSKTSEVEVKYYKGKQGVKLLYDDVLKAKELRAYVNAIEIAKVFPDNMRLFIKTHTKRKDMYIWEIMNRSPQVEKYAKSMAKGRYFYKFIPTSMNFSVVDYLIYDGKMAIIDIKENPTGTLIINRDYYKNAKAIFDFVWQMLPDPE